MSWTLPTRKAFAGYLLAVAALTGPAPAQAASSGDDYLKARKRAVAQILKVERNGSRLDAQTLNERLQTIEASYKTDLEKRLRGIIGKAEIKGFLAPGELNLASLMTDDRDFAKLDGVRLASNDGKGFLVISTSGLARHWATENSRQWISLLESSPTSIDLMLNSNAFYTWAVTYPYDGAIARFSALPIAKPANASVLYAFFAAELIGDDLDAPNRIVVAEIVGNRLLFTVSAMGAVITPIESCNRLRSEAKTALDAVNEAYATSHSPGNAALWAKAHTMKSSAEAAFASCFAESVKTQPAYTLVMKQAQTLANAMSEE